MQRARSAGRFEGPLRRAIHRLKYDGRKELAAPLGEWLVDMLHRGPFRADRFDLVVPVPLHGSRWKERGFNQAELLAWHAAGFFGIPVAPQALARTRATRHQVDLHARERAENVYGAFAVESPERIAGKRVLIVDDVATTLSTCDECARTLLEAGAASVSALTLARDL